MKTEGNMITDWLEEYGDAKIDLKVANEVIDKLLEQQSKLYSEEEVVDLLYKRSIYQDHFESNGEIMEWFEKFKKK